MSKTQFVDNSTPSGVPMPVVGWLVVIEGLCRGTDYRIHTGYNYIGREISVSTVITPYQRKETLT